MRMAGISSFLYNFLPRRAFSIVAGEGSVKVKLLLCTQKNNKSNTFDILQGAQQSTEPIKLEEKTFSYAKARENLSDWFCFILD